MARTRFTTPAQVALPEATIPGRSPWPNTTVTAKDCGVFARCIKCGIGTDKKDPMLLWGCRGGATVNADPSHFVCDECFFPSRKAA